MGIRLHLGPTPPIDVAALLSCTCGEHTVVKSQEVEGVEKVRNRVVLIHPDGHVSAVCRGCGNEVQLPLRRLDPGPDLYLEK